MSYESEFQEIEAVERQITQAKDLLAKLVKRREQLRLGLFSTKGAYAPTPTVHKGGGGNLAERSDGFWVGSEHR